MPILYNQEGPFRSKPVSTSRQWERAPWKLSQASTAHREPGTDREPTGCWVLTGCQEHTGNSQGAGCSQGADRELAGCRELTRSQELSAPAREHQPAEQSKDRTSVLPYPAQALIYI